MVPLRCVSKLKAIVVSSLYHSGSTLLDLLLSNHPNVVGLGELYRVITIGPGQWCSCGKPHDSCPFWSVAWPQMQLVPDNDPLERLGVLLRLFDELYDENTYLLDSSNTLDSLELFRKGSNVDIKVIHLIRDVRSWTYSLLKRDPNQLVGFGRITRGPQARFLQWYQGNREIQEYVSTNNVPNITVGYEEYVFHTNTIVSYIFEYLGLSYDNPLEDLGVSGSHIVRGNKMRLDRHRMERIQYDDRWLSSAGFSFTSTLLPFVMRYNGETVYSNIN